MSITSGHIRDFPPLLDWNRLKRGCNARRKTTKTSFSVSVQDSESIKVLSFSTALSLQESVCPVFPSSLLSLWDEQHCDRHSVLTVVIYHPPDSHLKV